MCSYRSVRARDFSALSFAGSDIVLVLAVVSAVLVQLVLNGLHVAVVQPGGVNVSWGARLVGLDAHYFPLDNIGKVKVVQGVSIS